MPKSLGLFAMMLVLLQGLNAAPVTITESCFGPFCVNRSQITGLGTTSLSIDIESEGNTLGGVGGANGAISVVIDVYTAGPVRPGMLQVFGEAFGLDADGCGIGNVAGLVSWNCLSRGGGGGVNALVPFTLGLPFEIDATAKFGCFGVNCGGAGTLMATIVVLDQGTAVPILPVPEPSSAALLLVGVVVMCWLRKVLTQPNPYRQTDPPPDLGGGFGSSDRILC
jgi:hypothetical protein